MTLSLSDSDDRIHADLRLIQKRLQDIHESICNYRLPTRRHPILDSSLDLNPDSSTEDSQWLQQDSIPGLKKMRDTVKIDLDVVEKFLDDPKSARLPPLSTNAPYLIAVWNEFLCAPPPVVSIFKSFPVAAADPSIDPRKKDSQRPPAAKVDVVAAGGTRWIRINTIKNSRMLAEFREIDSYLTDSSDEDLSSDEANVKDPSRPGTLAQTSFDNSILRMGRGLLEAARANPVEIPDSHGIISLVPPQVILRLTRLDPSSEAEQNDPRIAQTVQCLLDMGVEVALGEREIADIPELSSPPPLPVTQLVPSIHINLDLSLLIALVSDLTHATLPNSLEDANKRFIPPTREREWKKSTPKEKNGAEHGESDVVDADQSHLSDLAKHTRALTNQLMQEMGRSLIQEIRGRLPVPDDPKDSQHPSAATKVEFWTTPEAKERCLRIVSKIGGPNEKRRAEALFIPSAEQADSSYWKESRFSEAYIPLLPIKLYPSNVAASPPSLEREVASPVRQKRHDSFFTTLEQTCREILRNESDSLGAQADQDDEFTTDDIVPETPKSPKIRRATTLKANQRLTIHTVQSMLWGATLGWTTLTANRTSVKAILREMAGRERNNARGAVLSGEAPQSDEVLVGHTTSTAAIWLVDPRSLAEGMRADT